MQCSTAHAAANVTTVWCGQVQGNMLDDDDDDDNDGKLTATGCWSVLMSLLLQQHPYTQLVLLFIL